MARVRFREEQFPRKNPFFGQEGAGSIPKNNPALFREFYFQERRSHPPPPPPPARALSDSYKPGSGQALPLNKVQAGKFLSHPFFYKRGKAGQAAALLRRVAE